MRKQQQIRRSAQSRDDDLRAAHQRAFEQIREARSRSNYREAVTRALEELIDACEAYTVAHS